MTKEELLDKAIYWFKCIAEDMERITSGNLSRNAAITKRRAIRAYKFLENHKNDTLPSNIDEAIDKYTDNPANYLEYSDDGWEDKTDIDYVERAFKAGAEWMAKQGETLYDYINVDGKNQRWLGENLLQGDYDAGQAVIVQIRKV